MDPTTRRPAAIASILAVAMTKRLLNVNAGPDYRMAENFMPAIFGTQDVEEGRKAFEERREPAYQGN